MTPSSLLFTTTVTTGTLVALSSTNWLYLWMGMELNLLSFIPMIASSQKFQETEASVKYFIIQAIGSSLMLTAGVMASSMPLSPNMNMLINFIFLVSMMIKMGLAPCHQWLPHVMASMSWSMCLILSTWQKVSPLMMLSLIVPRNTPLLIAAIAALSALTGGLGGMNQAQLRTLLAYSSIGHMGWMLIALEMSTNMLMIYFSVYVIITSGLMFTMMFLNLINTNFSSLMSSMTSAPFLILMLIMFSLGGLPPLLGFIPKWMVISFMATKKMFIILAALITGSLLNLFYYFSMTFNFILTTKNASMNIAHTPTMLIIMGSLCSVSAIIFYM
uniref:NADH-ubiquinone oxidoreductase chain 2 n=1 Tax=Platynereis sp. 1 PA-2020 TaxID=2759231 RepID=A0A7G9UIW8_9ANNE|nr:NADH dehydrogenase subunit 2 [Platynereis sp. 1 PA-2020]